MRFVVFLVALGIAILILKFTEPIARFFGVSGWAEQSFGPGGTYTMYKLLALVIVLLGLFYWLPPAFLR